MWWLVGSLLAAMLVAVAVKIGLEALGLSEFTVGWVAGMAAMVVLRGIDDRRREASR